MSDYIIERPTSSASTSAAAAESITATIAESTSADAVEPSNASALVTIDMINTAYLNSCKYVKQTPLIRVEKLERLLGGAKIYLKLENLQHTGSFKVRGVTNKMLSLSAEELSRGVAAASSGNHAQAVAYIAAKLATKAIIVMPEDAPEIKIKGTLEYGAEVVLHGYTASDREHKCNELIEKYGYSLVHSYADIHLIAGHGTMVAEAAEQMVAMRNPDSAAAAGQMVAMRNPDSAAAAEQMVAMSTPDNAVSPITSLFDEIVIPCGAGGIVSGCAVAAKHYMPGALITAVEPAAIPRFTASLAAGAPVSVAMGDTIADGLRVNVADPLNFSIIKDNVDRILTIGEAPIRRAVREVMLNAKIIAEPSACVGIAAALEGMIDTSPGRVICFIISGGNIDAATLYGLLSAD